MIFFTKRALYNIDILLDEIHLFKDENIKRALLLTVTSAIRSDEQYGFRD